VLALCAALACAAAWGLPFVRVAPNRLLRGEPVYLSALMQGSHGWVAAALALGLGVLAVGALNAHRRGVHAVVAILLSFLLSALWLLAGDHARNVAHTGSELHRTALGAGYWTLTGLAWMAALDAVGRLQLPTLQQVLAQIAVCLPLAFTLGYGQELSIAKEYVNHQDVFVPAILRHCQIVLLAIAPAVAMGVPLAWYLTRAVALQRRVFGVLNVIQTIPSIALFGLLMVPLAWAAAQLPALGRAGISGVGLAPAVLALMLYALLPIVRATLAGLEQVPAATARAARALGFTPRQVLWHVELPLAFPVLLIGLRTAVVQTIGLAAVTALVGAGGLGSILFDGLGSAANELVMLGVIPMVLLAVLADAVFKALGALFNVAAA